MTEDILNKGILYYFLFNSAIVSIIFLLSVLKPHRLYKVILSKFFNMTFKYNNADWKVYNVLLFIIGFYGLLFLFLQLQIERKIESDLPPEIRMERLGRKWQIETNIWLATLVIICLVSVYRNAMLFTEEQTLRKKIEETDKEITEVEKLKKDAKP